jgi:uncharacterized NAD(P)/FAD-binding protein YdhS
MTRKPVITIIGAGFAGTALALHLLREEALLNAAVHLVEPRPVPGPGLAYSPWRPEPLLNVRARSLSLYATEPNHFTNWLSREAEAANGIPEFAARATYGRYLTEEMAAELTKPDPSTARLHWHRTTAVAATSAPDGRRLVQLAEGAPILSDYVVLALGNFPPPPPAGPDHAYLHHSGYHADPWGANALSSIAPDASVLLIGSGLTAVDVLLALRQQGHRAPVTVVARHGRWPAAHGPATAEYPDFYPELAGEATVLGTLKVVRRHLRQAAVHHTDWRPVLDVLRPNLGKIWAAWPLPEQQRFLRHLASLWAVARHRSPPQNAAAIAGLSASGFVQLHLGRVSEIMADGDQLRVRTRPGLAADCWQTARHVICCAGPLLDYSRIQTPLVESLRAASELLPDPLHLGMQTDTCGALLTAQGQPSPTLFTLGPSRRPAYFESTAVPELRQQAAALATELGQRTQAASRSITG